MSCMSMKSSGCFFIIVAMIVFFTWEWCLGWYISLFNSQLPQTGGFWSDYKKYYDVDSSKQDWFKIEELRSIAMEEGIAYLKDVNGILQKTGQLVISMDHFSQFYHILPDSFKNSYFQAYRYITYSLNPACFHAVMNYRDGQINLYFTNREDQALPGELLFPGLFPEDSAYFSSAGKPELKDWRMSDTSKITAQYHALSFRQFFGWVDEFYNTHAEKIIRDEFLVVDWINYIDSAYLQVSDTVGSFIIKVRMNQDAILWQQDFLPEHLPYIQECVRSEEYSF